VVGVQMTRGTGVWQRVEKGGQAPRCDFVLTIQSSARSQSPFFNYFQWGGPMIDDHAVEAEKVRAFEVGPAPLSNFPRKFKGAGGDWAPRVWGKARAFGRFDGRPVACAGWSKNGSARIGAAGWASTAIFREFAVDGHLAGWPSTGEEFDHLRWIPGDFA
jgi:hypothetical protein